ncbi:hypothetical protein Tco_0990835 [Tanacetum coccineum]|uniref:Uncharacterized protein n=1 Tax=Tanacetum coccineum TaxID=301880 RepID=A0ABQ5EXL3_9ASTR
MYNRVQGSRDAVESEEEFEEETEDEIKEEEEDSLKHFDTFPAIKELRYHEWLLKNPRPPWVKAKVRTGNLNNVKFSCMIGHFDKKQAYLDMESPINEDEAKKERNVKTSTTEYEDHEMTVESEEEFEEETKDEIKEEEEDSLKHFDTFPAIKELRYHEWLLKNPRPPWVKAKVRTGNFNNVKFSCMIGHFNKKQAYLDMESTINVMSRLHNNWIMSKRLGPRRKPSNPGKICNLVGRVKGLKFEQQQDNTISKINILWKAISEKLDDTPIHDTAGNPEDEAKKERNVKTSTTEYEDHEMTVESEEEFEEEIEDEIKEEEEDSLKHFDTFPAIKELRLYLMRRSLEVLRKFHWMILGGRFNQLSHVSSPLLSKPREY